LLPHVYKGTTKQLVSKFILRQSPEKDIILFSKMHNSSSTIANAAGLGWHNKLIFGQNGAFLSILVIK
jgi:hypothetical protein